ncbi:MAG: MFS transporter [Sphingomonadales bacterium]|nr:MFS transporter [Sphingomonadales bacterium]NCO49694.1 MFS transporter [Sphingomonadales bacterium]NCO98612.1 MFS transporter [Sphingomonadales bacterium]NCP26108.1 MFS transporter [Sphingomonadales bacterium]NCP44398.1 MFS transporter [Sphingomonadales bacterium]
MATTAQSGRAPRKFYGWTNVGLFFFIQFAASGFVYFAYSVVFPVMVETMAWNRGTASLAQSIALMMLGLAYPLTGYLLSRYGVRKTVTIGLLVMLSGLLLLIFTVSEIWQWILIWGGVMGLSFALTGPICSQTAMINWFSIKRSTTIGIVMTGSAVGGALAQPILTAMMDRFDSWRLAWLIAAAMVTVALIAAQFIINRPQDIGQFPDDVNPGLAVQDPLARNMRPKTHRTGHDWTMKQVIRTPTLYLLMLVTLGYLGTFFFLLNHGVLHLTDNGLSGLQAASIMGMAILGSGFARIPAGWLGDQFELRWTLFGSIALMAIGLSGFWLGHGVILLSAMGMLFGAGYGSLLVLGPVVVGNYYGERAFPIINSVLAPVMLPFAAAAPAGAGYIFEATGSYDIAFAGAISLLVAGLIAAFFMKPPLAPGRT